jgi:hypothetical protein
LIRIPFRREYSLLKVKANFKKDPLEHEQTVAIPFNYFYGTGDLSWGVAKR